MRTGIDVELLLLLLQFSSFPTAGSLASLFAPRIFLACVTRRGSRPHSSKFRRPRPSQRLPVWVRRIHRPLLHTISGGRTVEGAFLGTIEILEGFHGFTRCLFISIQATSWVGGRVFPLQRQGGRFHLTCSRGGCTEPRTSGQKFFVNCARCGCRGHLIRTYWSQRSLLDRLPVSTALYLGSLRASLGCG